MRTWLVLAGGESARFASDGRYGSDKLAVHLGDVSVRDATIAAVRRGDPQADVRVLGPEFGGGPARAVVAALSQVHTPSVGILAADMPFAGDVIARLCGQWQPGTQALVPVDQQGREQWLCAIYDSEALRVAAEALTSEASWHELVRSLDITRVTEELPLWDIDTVQDFESAQELWRPVSKDD